MKVFEILNELIANIFETVNPKMNVQKIPVYVKKNNKHPFKK